MFSNIVLIIFVITILPSGFWSTATESPNSSCQLIDRSYDIYNPPKNETYIHCENIGADGRSLDEVLLRSSYFIPRCTYNFSESRLLCENETYTFDELTHTVVDISVNAKRGNEVKITGTALSAMLNLNRLLIEGFGFDIYLNFTVSSNAFKNLKNLKALKVGGLAFAESSLKTFGDLKDRLERLSIGACSPTKKILKEVSKFTNLIDIGLFCEDEYFPLSTLKNSAMTLRSTNIASCQLPKIPHDFFKGMINLKEIFWKSSNITSIEDGAFDDLVELTHLNFEDNKIENLPPGLFNNNKKLEYVSFLRNGLENLSRNNFTHLNNPGRLNLKV